MAPPRRAHLTLSQLASYDDILTDGLVDKAYYWSTIRKNRSKYSPCRRLKQDDIRDILFDDVICTKDIKVAESRLAQLTGFQNFIRSLRTEGEKEHFRRHMRKYISIWLPDCPWEVATTNRYTILTQEAAVLARRDMKKGEPVKYLCGTLVGMTAEEEKDLDLTRRDFSIVRSSRRKASSLFLGPARFANHDCAANATLTITGSDGMTVVATRNIRTGEEITVTYGDDYFGIDNCECLCATCETLSRNGWAAGAEATHTVATIVQETIEEDTGSYKLRNKRKHGSTASTPALAATPEAKSPSPRMRCRVEEPRTPVRPISVRAVRKVYGRRLSGGERRSWRSSLWQELSPAPEPEIENAQASSNVPAATPSFTKASEMSRVASSQISSEFSEADPIFDDDEVALLDAGTPSSLRSDRSHSVATQVKEEKVEQPAGNDSVTATGILPTKEVIAITTAEEVLVEPPVVVADYPVVASSESKLQATAIGTCDENVVIIGHTSLVASFGEAVSENKVTLWNNPPGIFPESDLSDLASDEEFDETLHAIVKRKQRPRRGRPPKGSKTVGPRPTPIPSLEEPCTSRRPGDYKRTRELLACPGSSWADCHTCGDTWVQPEAHETHRECPRCERHSIIFGLTWPKTVPTKGDRPRVKDHREVSRILGPEEQKQLKRKNRGLEGTPVTDVGSRRESTVGIEDLKVPDGRRRSARRSHS